ncbi:MAG: PTS sugar transporter subunit IIA [Spirochaetales bacterium]|nr:PTS sugar transporter subunit IIA [Spirochaetales bacterium]
MVGIGNRLNSQCVLLDLEAADKGEVLRAMIGALGSVHEVEDQESLLKEILAREDISSTCIGEGCAIPHTQSAQLERSVMAAARLASPLDMDSPDGEPVSLVFLLAGPPRGAATHLKLLSRTARFLHKPELRKALLDAETPEAFLEILEQQE